MFIDHVPSIARTSQPLNIPGTPTSLNIHLGSAIIGLDNALRQIYFLFDREAWWKTIVNQSDFQLLN